MQRVARLCCPSLDCRAVPVSCLYPFILCRQTVLSPGRLLTRQIAKPLAEGKAITIQDDDFYRENGIAPPKEVLFDSMLLAETEEEVQGIQLIGPQENL